MKCDDHAMSLQRVISHLQKKRIRITKTRRAVIAYLIESDAHPSAEMIYADLHSAFPSMSLATVYNNLYVLVEEGFVTELKRSHDSTTYYDFMGHEHLNIICEQCGKVTDLEMERPSLHVSVQEQTGYHITKEVWTLYGICPNCVQHKEHE